MKKIKDKYLAAHIENKNFIIYGNISVINALFVPNNPNEIKFVYNGKIILSHETIQYEFNLQNIGGKYFIAERDSLEYQKLKNYVLLNENLVVNSKSTTKFKI